MLARSLSRCRLWEQAMTTLEGGRKDAEGLFRFQTGKLCARRLSEDSGDAMGWARKGLISLEDFLVRFAHSDCDRGKGLFWVASIRCSTKEFDDAQSAFSQSMQLLPASSYPKKRRQLAKELAALATQRAAKPATQSPVPTMMLGVVKPASELTPRKMGSP